MFKEHIADEITGIRVRFTANLTQGLRETDLPYFLVFSFEIREGFLYRKVSAL